MQALRRSAITLFFLAWASIPAAWSEPLRLVTLSYPPYEYEKDGQAEGIAVRVVRETFDRLDTEISIQVLPWKRALLQVREGQAAAIFTAFKTPERLKYLDYSKTVLMPQVVSVWARRGQEHGYDGSLSSIAQKTVGLVEGISYGAKVDDAVRGGLLHNVDYAAAQDRNIGKLLLGRLDMVIMNRYSARYQLARQNGLDQVTELEPPLQDVPSYIAFSKKRNLTALRARVDVTLQDMKQSGLYRAIIDDYFDRVRAGNL